MKLIVDYYKYHCDVPRLYMLPIVKFVNKYHDKHRKVKYKHVMN